MESSTTGTPSGTVASTDDQLKEGWAGASPPVPCTGTQVKLRRVPLPARGHHAGGPLVLALWLVVQRCRGVVDRTRDPGRSCHGVSVGAAVHSITDRRGTALPARRRRSLVR